MATYTKETALYDTGAIANDIANAGTTATNYITYVDTTNGIRVYDGQSANQNVNFAQINSSGLQVYKGGTAASNKVAEFGNTTRIGKSSTSHIELDYHSLKLIGKEGSSNTYLHVSDLRDENGVATITSSYAGDGITTTFDLDANAVDTKYTVTIDGETAATSSKTKTSFTLNTAPSTNSVILATYTTANYSARAFTFGSRSNDSIGANSVVFGDNCAASRINSFATGSRTEASGTASHAEGLSTRASAKSSHAEGWSTVASGLASHAEGSNTTASGDWSHAEGHSCVAQGSYSHAHGFGTLTKYRYQTAIGTYNECKPSSIFEVGNGFWYDNTRSNALSLTGAGDLTIDGGFTANGYNSVTDRAVTQALSGTYPGQFEAERFGKFIYMTYKIGAITLGASSTVAILSLYSDIRPKYETIVPANITDANYATVGTGLIRFETGGWVYLVTPKSLSQTGGLYVMFTAFYLI